MTWLIACSGPSLAHWMDAGLRTCDCAVNDASMVLGFFVLACMDEPLPGYGRPQAGTITRPVSMRAHQRHHPAQILWDAYGLDCDKPYFSSEAALRWAMFHGYDDITIIGCDLSGDVHVTGSTGAEYRPPTVKSSGLSRWQYERRLLAQVWRDAHATGVRMRRLRHPDQHPAIARRILFSHGAPLSGDKDTPRPPTLSCHPVPAWR